MLIACSVVEINTGLICGCTPAMKPFLRYLLSKSPLKPPQQHSDTESSTIWMGKHPDDQSHSNYRNYIELECSKYSSEGVTVQVVMD